MYDGFNLPNEQPLARIYLILNEHLGWWGGGVAKDLKKIGGGGGGGGLKKAKKQNSVIWDQITLFFISDILWPL